MYNLADFASVSIPAPTDFNLPPDVTDQEEGRTWALRAGSSTPLQEALTPQGLEVGGRCPAICRPFSLFPRRGPHFEYPPPDSSGSHSHSQALNTAPS